MFPQLRVALQSIRIPQRLTSTQSAGDAYLYQLRSESIPTYTYTSTPISKTKTTKSSTKSKAHA